MRRIEDSSDGQEIHVDGENTGTVTFTVKALERSCYCYRANPQQYARAHLHGNGVAKASDSD